MRFAFVRVLIFAAIAFGTVTVKIETVVSQANAMFCGNFTLTRFDGIITKFDNLAAVEADQVIVVMLLCQFKYGFTAFKIVAGDDTSVVKLVQYAIYRSQTNFFTHIDQTFV
eukprot:380333_1